MKKNFLKLNLLSILIISLLTGFFIGRITSAKSKPTNATEELHNHQKEITWTCSMHPQIKLPMPGKCPLCAMDLIPLKMETIDETGQERILTMSESDKKLAQIQTKMVERKWIDASIEMFGKIEYDETQIKTITAWVPGRLDRLFVDYTGIRVNKGDHLAMIYSPNLLTAQEELIEAKKRVDNSGKNIDAFLNQSNVKILESAREKLKLLGINEEQIKKIENNELKENHLLLTAPISGIVIDKVVHEGMYVKTGSKLFTIADLKHLWLNLDAYESDLSWLRYGQKVEFKTDVYPGEVFKATIAYINPVLDPKTRTVKIRVNIDNLNGMLKPGMFASAVVHSKIALGGKVIDPEIEGLWICPMHPEIRKSEQGKCDLCEMKLAKPKDLGYKSPDKNLGPPVVIPDTAVLITGKRAVVYVELPNKEKPTFEGREIILGPRVGNYYIVNSGITEGEKVVVNGNFKIDSALQIRAKPSMMNPQVADHNASNEGRPETKLRSIHSDGDVVLGANAKDSEKKMLEKKLVKIPKDFTKNLERIMTTYFDLSTSLSKDDSNQSKACLAKLSSEINSIPMSSLPHEVHMKWMNFSSQITKVLKGHELISDLKKQRHIFMTLSKIMIEVIKTFGNPKNPPIYQGYCPMAADGKGASWLQTNKEIKNPFFGASMLSCGTIENKFPGKEDGK